MCLIEIKHSVVPYFSVVFPQLSPVYGNDITGTSGQIASPLYPRTYPEDADYRWTITVSADSYISLRFLDIDIEDLYECYFDQLKVSNNLDLLCF